MTYLVLELVGSSHVLAEAVEGIGDGRVVSKISPSGATLVAGIHGQTVASEKEQQEGQNGREVGLHVDGWRLYSMIEDFLVDVGEGSLMGCLTLLDQDGVMVRCREKNSSSSLHVCF